MKFSLGNIGSVEQACNAGSFHVATDEDITETGEIDQLASINLYCSYGKLDAIDSFGSFASNQLFACSDYTGSNYEADQEFEYYPDTCYYDNFSQEVKN